MHVRRYSTREVATALDLCVETVRRAIRRGELEATPTGRRGHYWHVYQDQLLRWINGEGAKKVLARSLSYTRRSPNRQAKHPSQGPDDDTHE